MNTHNFFRFFFKSGLVIFILLALPAHSRGMATRQEIEVGSAVHRPLGGHLIPIAVSPLNEIIPSVELCGSDQYLVVYQTDGMIYGQRLDQDGSLLEDTFSISGIDFGNREPKVACNWVYNRFVVVWEHDDDMGTNIHAQAIHGAHQPGGGGAQLVGGQLVVNATLKHELSPSIACNDTTSCLLVYEYLFTASDAHIYAQRIGVYADRIELEGAVIFISVTPENEILPNVAWGGEMDEFLVVWQQGSGANWQIRLQFVHDTFQHSGQLKGIAKELINPGYLSNFQVYPNAAYNHQSQSYLVTFQYDQSIDRSNYDILARYVAGDSPIGDVIVIAGTAAQEKSPRIAFSGGTQNLPDGAGANEFLVTFIRHESTPEGQAALMGRAVPGSWSDEVTLQRPFLLYSQPTAAESHRLFNGDVTGSFNTGQYLAVWDDFDSTGTHSDVLGKLLSAQNLQYLPLMLR